MAWLGLLPNNCHAALRTKGERGFQAEGLEPVLGSALRSAASEAGGARPSSSPLRTVGGSGS